MPVTITAQAVEKSSFAITVGFTDENGDAVAPVTAVWSLVTPAGAIVNGREDVAIGTPASSETILLQGDDLAMLTDKSVEARYLVIEATYNSSLGSDLPFNDQVRFEIVNLKKVPN